LRSVIQFGVKHGGRPVSPTPSRIIAFRVEWQTKSNEQGPRERASAGLFLLKRKSNITLDAEQVNQVLSCFRAALSDR
jgi:hypothetical protein